MDATMMADAGGATATRQRDTLALAIAALLLAIYADCDRHDALTLAHGALDVVAARAEAEA